MEEAVIYIYIYIYISSGSCRHMFDGVKHRIVSHKIGPRLSLRLFDRILRHPSNDSCVSICCQRTQPTIWTPQDTNK
jgi:hypothetical protein